LSIDGLSPENLSFERRVDHAPNRASGTVIAVRHIGHYQGSVRIMQDVKTNESQGKGDAKTSR
jgi:hypothetical protein